MYSIVRKSDGFIISRTHDRETALELYQLHGRAYGWGRFDLIYAQEPEPFYPPEAPTEAEYRAAHEATIDADFDLDERDPETPLLPGQKSW